MSEERFDALSRRLAVTTTRRGALKLLAGAAGGAALTAFGLGSRQAAPAAAANKPKPSPTTCGDERIIGKRCGGIAGDPCPAGYECVDDPRDACDPSTGADCAGTCQPVCQCGDNVCGPGQYCCNPSCGICAALDGYCIMIACEEEPAPVP